MKRKTKILLLAVSAALGVAFAYSVCNLHNLPSLSYFAFESLLLSESREQSRIESVSVETGNPVIQVKLKDKPTQNLQVPDDKRAKIFTILHERDIPIYLLGRQ